MKPIEQIAIALTLFLLSAVGGSANTIGLRDNRPTWRFNTDTPASPSDSADTSPGLPKRLVSDATLAVAATGTDLYRSYTSPARINRRTALIVGGVIVAGGLIYIYDQEIHDAFVRSNGRGPIRSTTDFGENFYDVGHGGKSTKFYLGGLAVGYVTGLEPLRKISIDVVESYIIAGSVKNVFNLLAGRSRPFSGEGPRMFRFNEGTSLPSGHASNVFQLARIVSYHLDYWPVTITVYGIATSVAVQRITSGSHWPSDVLAGALLGYFVADFVVKQNEQRRLKIAPTLAQESGGAGLAVRYSF